MENFLPYRVTTNNNETARHILAETPLDAVHAFIAVDPTLNEKSLAGIALADYTEGQYRVMFNDYSWVWVFVYRTRWLTPKAYVLA